MKVFPAAAKVPVRFFELIPLKCQGQTRPCWSAKEKGRLDFGRLLAGSDGYWSGCGGRRGRDRRQRLGQFRMAGQQILTPGLGFLRPDVGSHIPRKLLVDPQGLVVPARRFMDATLRDLGEGRDALGGIPVGDIGVRV